MESEERGGWGGAWGVFSPGGRTERVDGAGERRSGEPGVIFSFFSVSYLSQGGRANRPPIVLPSKSSSEDSLKAAKCLATLHRGKHGKWKGSISILLLANNQIKNALCKHVIQKVLI